MRRDRREGETYPTFYGPAYHDWDRDVQVCYPIPIHLLVRIYRDFVMHARQWWRPSHRDMVERTAFRRGFDAGYEHGKWAGAEAFRSSILADLDAKRKRP